MLVMRLVTQRAESSTGRGTGGHNKRSCLLVEGLVSVTSWVVCRARDWWAQRAESALLVKRLVGEGD